MAERALAAILALAATLAVYAAARVLQRCTGSVLLHPVLVSIVVLIAALRLLGSATRRTTRAGGC